MDDLVEKALARWPNVPAIAGWMKLDCTGNWLLTGPVPQGLTISNSRILNFIARNYACEPDGRYYFQNGPQKAYVHLEYTPWVYRLMPIENQRLMLVTHTGLLDRPQALFQDELGRVLIQGQKGVGLLHSHDMAFFASGLTETPDGLCHQALWCVPDDPQGLVSTRIPLRRDKWTQEGETHRSLRLSDVLVSQVPAQFGFNPNPTVNPPDSKS